MKLKVFLRVSFLYRVSFLFYGRTPLRFSRNRSATIKTGALSFSCHLSRVFFILLHLRLLCRSRRLVWAARPFEKFEIIYRQAEAARLPRVATAPREIFPVRAAP